MYCLETRLHMTNLTRSKPTMNNTILERTDGGGDESYGGKRFIIPFVMTENGYIVCIKVGSIMKGPILFLSRGLMYSMIFKPQITDSKVYRRLFDFDRQFFKCSKQILFKIHMNGTITYPRHD